MKKMPWKKITINVFNEYELVIFKGQANTFKCFHSPSKAGVISLRDPLEGSVLHGQEAFSFVYGHLYYILVLAYRCIKML